VEWKRVRMRNDWGSFSAFGEEKSNRLAWMEAAEKGVKDMFGNPELTRDLF